MPLVAERMVQRVRGWLSRARRRSAHEDEVDYADWIRRRIIARRKLYPAPPRIHAPRFSVLTLVYNTEPRWLEAAARSLLRQDYSRWEWVIWDNGSTRDSTSSLLARLSADSRIRVVRSEANLGITAGHLAALPHCRGDYLALLDHDDRLYPDALRVAAWHIAAHSRPPFLYSDEDKLDAAGRVFCPFLKPDWNPALLQSTGYTCHLAIIRRELAGPLGLFTDLHVDGATDWDVALRVHDAGLKGVHIPEVLYSWRVHPESTAGLGVEAKPYALVGQRRCLEQSLARRGLAGRFDVVSNPLYPYIDGHWHLAGRPGRPGRHRMDGSAGESFVTHFPSIITRVSARWLQEAVALLELNPDAGLVGGRVLDAADRMIHGLPITGMGDPVGTPWPGSPADEIGYFGFSLTPRHVTVLGEVPCVARREALDAIGVNGAEPLQTTEICHALQRKGWQILWTPHMTAWAEDAPSTDPRRAIGSAAPGGTRDPFYSPHFSLDPKNPFRLCKRGERG